MYTKKNARVTFKSNRRPGFKRNSNFSNGRGRNKGNVTQQYNKYLKLAKEALTSGDRVQSEYYYQFTDHYHRQMVELGINIDENEISLETKSDTKIDNQVKEPEIEQNDKHKNKNIENNLSTEIEDQDENVESIESIPFIAEPAKKKKVRNSK